MTDFVVVSRRAMFSVTKQMSWRRAIAAELYAKTFSAKIKRLNEIKKHPEFFIRYSMTPEMEKFLNFLIAINYQRRADFNNSRAVRASRREERRLKWISEKRARVYRKNHPFGELEHDWLNYGIVRRTGLQTGDGFDKSTDESSFPCCETDCVAIARRMGFTTKCLAPPSPPVIRKVVKKEIPLPKWDKNSKIFKNQPVKVRSLYLLAKIQSVVATLKNKRVAKTNDMVFISFEDQYRKCIQRHYRKAFQKSLHNGLEDSDAAHGAEGEASVDKAGNVALTRQSEESKGSPDSVKNLTPLELSTNDTHPQYDSFMDRYLLLDTITWDTSKLQGDLLQQWDLPLDIVKLRTNSPNISFFKLYQYVQCDMEIKIQVNAQPMAQGQLQCSWKYMTAFEEHKNWYDNVQSLSQTDHVLISANDENPGCLYVPYRHVKPSLATTIRSDQDMPLRLGSLQIRVLNALKNSTTSCSSVDLSIWVRFLNGKFSGMKSSDIGKVEHNGIWDNIKNAEFHLNCDARINNQDKPPIQIATQPVIIGSNQSFSAGTNTAEPINSLRLDMRGQSQNVESAPDDMSISKIANIFGFVRTLNWHVCDPTSTLLTTIDASPMFNLSEYSGGIEKTDRYYNLPPVAVLSEQFLYWRGSLELRMDFIATAFHKGKLMVAYVPRELDNVSMSQAIGCPHVIFDLSQQKQFSFIVPWVTNQHYWPRRFGIRNVKDNVEPPGRIYIFIQNKLSKQENVSDVVQINLYWRGGKDFEVAVPSTNALSLPWNPAETSAGAEFKAGPGYYPYYVGQWRYFGDADRPILRYGTGADHVAQFINVPDDVSNKICVYLDTSPLIAYAKGSTGIFVETKFTHGVIVADGSYRYMAMCASVDQAKKYLDYQKFPDQYKKKPIEALYYVRNDDKGQWGGLSNASWRIETYEPKPPEFTIGGFELVQHNGEKDDVVQTSVDVTQGSFFMRDTTTQTFGEKFNSLKDLCRRYQPYDIVNLNTGGDATSVDKIVPVRVDGVKLPAIKSSETDKQYLFFKREGHIPLICSGFRFFRGSLRFRILSSGINQYVYAIHIPELQNKDTQWTPTAASSDAFYSPTYASYIQSAFVNPVISLEVPFYNPNNSIFPNPVKETAKKELNGLIDMGSLAISAAGGKKNNIVPAQIFYSFGDDAMLHCFQGFPSLILRMQNFTVTEHNGLMDYLSWKPTVKIDLGVKEIMDSPQFKEFQESLSSFGITTASEILCQLIHVSLNPCWKTIVWSMISIGIQLKFLKMELFDSLVPIFTSICDKIKFMFKFTDQPDNSNGDWQRVDPNGIDDPEWITDLGHALASLLSIIGICTGFSNMKKPKNIMNFTRTFLNGLNSAGKGYQGILGLFVNTAKLIKKMAEYIMYWKCKDMIIEKYVTEELPVLSMWTEEALKLLNVENEDRVYTLGSSWAERMEVTYTLGSRILKSITDYKGTRIQRDKFQPFMTLFKQICEKRDMMYRRGASVVSRKDPFCLYLSGPPGIGKSVLASKLCTTLLREANVPILGEPIFTLPNGAKYWNGCRNQPAILIDDFLSVNSGNIQEEAIRAFMEIKSSAVLNPPMASLSEKELRYAPELMLVLSNEAFPVVNHCNLEAMYRRRDALVFVDLNDRLKEAGLSRISGHTKAELEEQFNIDMARFEHFSLRVAGDPTGGMQNNHPATVEGAQLGRSLTYEEFVRRIIRDFRDHIDNQEELYQMRVEALNDFMQDELDDDGSLEEKLNEYRNVVRLLAMLPVKEHASYKEYMKLVYDAATGQHISQERIDMLVDLRGKVQDRFTAFQREQQEQQRQNLNEPNVFRVPEENVDHNAPNSQKYMEFFEHKFVEKDVKNGIRHVLQYIKGFDTVLYVKEVEFKYKKNRSNKIVSKFIPMSTNLRFAYIDEQLRKRFQLLKHVEVKPTYDNHSVIFHLNVEDKVKVSSFLEDLKTQTAAKNYVPVAVVNEQGDFLPTADISEDMIEEEICNLYTNMYQEAVDPSIYYKHFEDIINDKTKEAWYVPSVLQKVFNQMAIMCKGLTLNRDQSHHQKVNRFINIILWKYARTEKKFKAIFGTGRYKPEHIIFNSLLVASCYILRKFYDRAKVRELFDDATADIPDFQVFSATYLEKAGFDIFLGNELQEIFGENSMPEYTCKHFMFDQYARWQAPHWELINRRHNGTQVEMIKDGPCERIQDKVCFWSEAHLCRVHAQLWKFFNTSLYNVIIRGTIKPYLFRDGAKVDQTYWESFKICFEKTFNFIKTVAAMIIGTIIVLILVLGPVILFIMRLYYIIKAIGWLINTFRGEPTPDHNSYNSDLPKASKSPPNFKSFFTRPTQHNNDEGVRHSYQDKGELVSVIKSNTFFVRGDQCEGDFRVLFLGDTNVLFLKHYHELFIAKGCKKLTFRQAGSESSFDLYISDIQFIFNEQNSCGIAILPRPIILMKHIYKRFQPMKQIKHVPKSIVFVEVEDTVTKVQTLDAVHCPGVVVSATPNMSEQILTDLIQYDYGGFGKCCSLVIDPVKNYILGVHVCGKPKRGFSEIFSKESFIDLFDLTKPEPSDISFDSNDNNTPFLKGDFVYHGRVDKFLAHHNSNKTKIQRTKIYGVTPVHREPAPLAQGDERVPIERYSPLISGCENMLKPVKEFPKELLDKAYTDINQQVLSQLEPIYLPIEPLSYYEAIVGIPGMDYYDGLDMTTSEGFPLSRYRPNGVGNKSWLFDRNCIDQIGIHPKLQQIMDNNSDARLNGLSNVIVHDDCLKDALIPKSKLIKPGKTRIFSVSPVQYTIQFKQFYTHFLAAFKAQRLKFEHAIGINCNSFEWGMLVRYLHQTGATKMVTGDYSNFGPGLNTTCVLKAFEIMINWLDKYYGHNETYLKYLHALKYEVVYAYHLCNNLLYQVKCGLPSGNPATVEANSLVNMLYIRCAWLDIMKSVPDYKYFIDHYHLHVRLCTYGDDLIMSVTDEISEFFNSQTLQTFFAKYDIIYTDAQKGDDIQKYTDLRMSQFLKRGFIPHPQFKNQWLAPLDLDSVLDTPNWCKSYLSIDEGTKESACAALAEAYGHGRIVYDDLLSKLREALQKVNIPCSLRTWDDWDLIHFPEFYKP